MTEKEQTQISIFMTLILRHRPDMIGEKLDANGWMKTAQLLRGVQKKYPKLTVTLDDIRTIVSNCDKKRFTLDAHDTRIRANQGHSVKLEGSTVKETAPPAFLYHGTTWANVGAILKSGLNPMSRIHVHLSSDRETAAKVGARHGAPVIFLVDSKRAHGDGIRFYLSDNGVWLCDALPAKYLTKEESTGE